MNNVYMFPGQGTQHTGMGKDLYDRFDIARKIYDRADEIVGFSVKDLSFNATDEQLAQTANSQLVVFLHSFVCFSVLQSKIGNDATCQYYTGLSLGEYTALAASSALTFEETLILVKKRGEYMQEAAQIRGGGLISIMGIDRMTVEKFASICGVKVANYNSYEQFVISGSDEGINKVLEKASEFGVKRCIKLSVKGAFHTEAMMEARDRLSPYINALDLKVPKSPVVSNVTAVAHTDPAQIKKNLIEQISSPTYWCDSVIYMCSNGVKEFIEFGPGKTLRGLIRRIDPNLELLGYSTEKDFNSNYETTNQS